jgi:hypothetical protein
MKMKNRIIISIVATSVILLLILALIYPEPMISPGKPIDAHADLAADCFACHTPFIGSRSAKCIDCHKVEEIGLKTTKGLDISREKKSVAFHQELIEDDCIACHSDHRGVKAFRPISQFSHNLLKSNLHNQCDSCHSNPDDELHRPIKRNCSDCHTQDAWSPANFKHEEYFLLKPIMQKRCDSCHKNPSDDLHRQVRGGCGQCHGYDAWIPATFEHEKYFRFDRDHTTDCATCHLDNNYSDYTCYGCHEHSRSKIRGEHVEEGIREYENCVECHRSGDEDEAERIWRSKRGERKYRGDDDDDHEDHDDD